MKNSDFKDLVLKLVSSEVRKKNYVNDENSNLTQIIFQLMNDPIIFNSSAFKHEKF